MLKPIHNLIVRLAVSIYARVSKNKIRRLTQPCTTPPALRSILAFSTTALGDTLLSTPALVSLRQSFPDARITLFISKKIAPLLEGLECVDDTVIYHGGFKKFWPTLMQLRRTKPDAALLLHSNGPQDIPLAVLSGATIILKPPTSSEYRHYLSWQFTPKQQHVIEERLDLVRWLGGSELTSRMHLPGRYAAQQATAPHEPQTTVGFQVGAANTFKMWPAENFAALADQLTNSVPDINIVITGSRTEHGIAQKIIQASQRAKIHNACGEYTIADLPLLIRQFKLLVSNDTGTMHLAIALGIPTICLFGQTSPQLIGPYQDMAIHRVIHKQLDSSAYLPKKKRTDSAMRLISVAEVHASVMEALGRPIPPAGKLET